MGGFFDIRRRRWNRHVFRISAFRKRQLATPFGDASFGLQVWEDVAEVERMPRVPVYSCGNDQCCSAIGAGLEKPGDVVCTFGTAMVAYIICDTQPGNLSKDQIAGIV